MNITFQNVGSVIAALDTFATELQGKVVGAINDTVLFSQSLAETYCPVDTGELRSAITSEPASSGNLTGAMGIPDGIVLYAWYVHHGHYTRNHQSYVSSQPFVLRAFFEAEPFYYNQLQSIL